MMENQERYEQVYNSTLVSSAELKRYQSDRRFAARVVKFKRKQASLQDQNDLFLSTGKQDELWRRLESEREALIAENSFMFHKVMNDPKVPLTQYNDRQPKVNQMPVTMQMHRRPESAASSISSRVVAGAALQISSTDGRGKFKIPPAIAGNTT
ncbi:hypothetical protein V7S43_013700 [Phytophthora oleae]|uniref:BZIP domain-containing protein n=1 Tax=Phytophthora oleae TaxID=2107226 RepID=A0ABD3F5X5_9STRA